MAIVKRLHTADSERKLNANDVNEIIALNNDAAINRKISISNVAFSKYFTDEQSADEVSSIIEQALAAWQEQL
jgi:hypothetical protein